MRRPLPGAAFLLVPLIRHPLMTNVIVRPDRAPESNVKSGSSLTHAMNP